MLKPKRWQLLLLSLVVILSMTLTAPIKIGNFSLGGAGVAGASTTYYKSILINGSADGNLTNYQMRFIRLHYGSGSDSESATNGELYEIYASSHCATDFSNVEFLDSTNVVLCSALLDKVDSDYADFAVKVPLIPVSPGNTTIRLVYGTGITTNSDFANTFLFGDDFGNITSYAPAAGNPIIANGVTLDTISAGDPCVRKNGDNDWQMWYYGYDGTHTYVLYANATAPGGPWTKDAAHNPILTDYHKGCVVKDSNGHYHMWTIPFTGVAYSALNPRDIYYFYTTDAGGHNPYGPFTKWDGTELVTDSFTGDNHDAWGANWTQVTHGTLKAGSVADIQTNQGRLYQASNVNGAWSGLEEQNQVNRTLYADSILSIKSTLTVEAGNYFVAFGIYKSTSDLWTGPLLRVQTDYGVIELADQVGSLAHTHPTGTHTYELQVRGGTTRLARVLQDGVPVIGWTAYSALVTDTVRVAYMAYSASSTLAARYVDNFRLASNQNPVICPAQSWEDWANDGPVALYDSDDSTWKVWYTSGADPVDSEPENWMYATASAATGPWTKNATDYGRIKTPGGTTKWYDMYLGAISVSKVGATYYGMYGSYDYNRTCRIGIVSSASPTDWSLAESQLVIDIGNPGDWNGYKSYFGTMFYDAGTWRIWMNGKTYNATPANQREQIGYFELTANVAQINTSKWVRYADLGKTYTYAVTGGILTLDSQCTGTTAYDVFLQSTTYKPPANVTIEARTRWNSTKDAYASWYPLWLSNKLPYGGSLIATHIQFMLADEADDKVKHQSENAGAWGSEDLIVNAKPTFGTYYIAKAIKRSADMDWRFLDGNYTELGAENTNTDVPQGVDYYLSLGARGANVDYDWVIVSQSTANEPTFGASGSEEILDISNAPASHDFLIVQPSQTYWAKTGLTPPGFPLAAGNCTGNTTNLSSFTLDYLTVVITDFSGGTAINIVSTAPGANEVRVMIFESGAGNDTDGIYLTNAAQNWVADVAADEEVYWELKLEMGNRNTFAYGVYTATLTFSTDPVGDTEDVIITFTWGDRRRGSIGIAPAFFY